MWPPAKRNVYTNAHNCSVRSHGELTTPRRGAAVISARQVLGAAVGNREVVVRGRAGWIYIRLQHLSFKHPQHTQPPCLISGPREHLL